MKEVFQSYRSSAQKDTSKSLQRVIISSGLSIALCMGCIAGSAWSLFQSDINIESAGRLSLAGLNPKITFLKDGEVQNLPPIQGDANTFLLEPGVQYNLSLFYLSTEDDLGSLWDVDALLSFKTIGEPQLQENHDLPAQEPETQPTEPTSEETTEIPDGEEDTEEDTTEEEDTEGEDPEGEGTEEETTEGEGTEGEETEEEETEGEGTEGEETEGEGTEGENTEGEGTEGEDTEEEETEEETSEEETSEEEERRRRLEELQKLLDDANSGDSLDYPVPMVRDENSNSFSVDGVMVRQETLVTFRTVKLISAEEAAKAAAFSFDTVPNYYQNDYPDTMYGSGTVASSGCSAVSLAMIATYMTNHTYLPDEMARYFGGVAENNMARLEKGLDTLRIPYEKPANIDIAYKKLLEGKVGIALMGPDSYFTNSQHFIVLRGVTEDGKILVNDPNRDNEGVYPTGFREGFTKGTVTTGYLGAWLFDKSEMPEEPYIYHVPEPVHGIPRYPDIHITASQKQVIAKIVYLEARGESPEGQQAVAEVILNRLASNRFGLTLKDIIFGEGQFRTTELLDTADPYQAQYDAIERAIWGPYVLPSDVYYFGRKPVTNNVWGKIGNHVFSGAPIR